MGVVVDRDEGLFPLPGEIKYTCDCPDWAGMCKHIAAVIYGIGARLDTKPELLFTLRGVDHQELISADAAAGAIAGSGSQRTRRRALAGQDLEGVFGVELEDASDEAAGLKAAKGMTSTKGSAKRKIAKVPAARAKPAKAAKPGAAKGAAPRSTKRKKAGVKPAPRTPRRPAPFKPSARSIAALRRSLKMNKAEFARAVGVSAPTITNWESSTGSLLLHDKNLAGLRRLHARQGSSS
jgi:hypothetical protein